MSTSIPRRPPFYSTIIERSDGVEIRQYGSSYGVNRLAAPLACTLLFGADTLGAFGVVLCGWYLLAPSLAALLLCGMWSVRTRCFLLSREIGQSRMWLALGPIRLPGQSLPEVRTISSRLYVRRYARYIRWPSWDVSAVMIEVPHTRRWVIAASADPQAVQEWIASNPALAIESVGGMFETEVTI